VLLIEGGLSHLHDRGLEESEANDVSAYAAQRDPVADAEGVAAEDHEVGGQREDHALKSEREPGGDQTHPGRDVGVGGDPDRQYAERQHDRGDDLHALTGPEAAGVGDLPAEQPADQEAGTPRGAPAPPAPGRR